MRFGVQRGAGLLEVVTVLAVIAILAGLMLPLTIRLMDDRNVDATLTRLRELQVAITGSPVIVINEARTSFGYLGDMGNLPPALSDLWERGSQPAFTFDTNLKVGAGWKGPYLDPEILSFLESLDQDAWGREFLYDTTPFTDPQTGAQVVGKIASAGADGVFSSSDDLTKLFFSAEVRSRVFGFVKDADGNAVAGARVTMNHPSGGVLSTVSVFTNSDGFYQFTDVPYGNRSITIEPRLVLAPDTALVKGTDSNDVEFVVKNFSNQEISVTTFKALYGSTPQGFYKTLKVNKKTKFSGTPRKGSGDTVDFSGSPEVVTGSGALAESFPIRIQSPATEVADLVIGKIGKGGSIKIEMLNFRDAATGNANPVDMTGVTFEVRINEGTSTESIIIFTPTL